MSRRIVARHCRSTVEWQLCCLPIHVASGVALTVVTTMHVLQPITLCLIMLCQLSFESTMFAAVIVPHACMHACMQQLLHMSSLRQAATMVSRTSVQHHASCVQLVRTQWLLKHLHNVETRFYCPQTFLYLDFQCRDDVSEIK